VRTVLAIDRDPWAVATYRANFPGVEVLEGDLREFVALGHADVIIGGPPCTPFSPGGLGLGADDPSDCIPAFVDAVARVHPLQFLMENVPGALRAHPDLAGRFARLGYRVELKQFDAVAHGVPQHRTRVWAWGVRGDVAGVHAWPEPSRRPNTGPTLFDDRPEWVTLGDVIPSAEVPERRRIEGASGYSGQRILDPREPVPTITSAANPEFIMEGGKLRRLTVAECMPLQSGPADFRWPEGIPKAAQYSIVGNGWPCFLAYKMRLGLERAVPHAHTVLDLFCGGGLAAAGFHGRVAGYCPTVEDCS
jgi:DNA (cytosine-5)-methyltransferase 1